MAYQNPESNINSHRKDNYITDPPLENQVQSIKQLFNNLITIINDNIQSSNDDDGDNNNDDYLLQNKNETKKNNSLTPKSVGIELKASLHKLFVDTVKSLRHAQKHNQADNMQFMKSYLLNQFNDLQFNLQHLRAEMINLLQDTIKIKKAKLSNSLVFDYENLMEEIMSQFCEDLYDIYLKMIQYNDSDFSSAIFNSLFNGIYDFTKDLEKYHLELIQLVDCILRPVNATANFIENCPEFSKENLKDKSPQFIYKQKEAKLKDFYGRQLNEVLNDFKEAISSIAKYNKHLDEFSLKFYEQLVDANVNYEIFDPLRIYEPRCTGFTNICNFYGLRNPEPTKNSKSESDEESENEDDNENVMNNPDLEGIWEALRFEQCTNFAREDLTQTGSSLQADLFNSWGRMASSDQSFSVGSLLYTVLNARFEFHDPGLSLSDVSTAYKIAVMDCDDFAGEEEDSSLSSDFQSLLEGVIDRAGSTLLALRHKQIRYLSSPPEQDGQNEYMKQAKQLSRDIQSLALDLNAALFNGREADFAISQRRIAYSSLEKNAASSTSPRSRKGEEEEDEIEEEEDFIDYPDNFQSYENEESDEIIKQLDKIIALNNTVFSDAKNRTNADFNDRKRLTQTTSSSQKMQQNEKRLMTKSMKMSIQRNMSDETLTQAKCIENAMVSTYTQLLASIKGTLVAQIRTSNIDQAIKVKKELNERILELMGHLDSIKKRAKVKDDVQTIKETDKRISELKGSDEESLKYCIFESLRNVIDVTISNYSQNIRLIDAEFENIVSAKKADLMKRIYEIRNAKHIPDLVLIEKKKFIETKKEEQRRDPNNYDDDEAAIERYIEKKKYALAQREKEKLALKKEKEKKKRFKKIEDKYKELTDNKLDEQKEELLMMENRFKKMKKEERRKANKRKDDLKLTLSTTIRTMSLRHYQLALKIINVDPKSKREMQKMLNEVVNDSIDKKRKIKGVADLINEQGKKTDWMQ